MNTTSILPPYLQYLQALALVAIPVVGTIIAGIGARIALQQMRIARMKLDHDRYEKRLKVFDAARRLLSEAVVADAISDATFKQFVVDTAETPFHFGDEIVQYLKRLETLAGSLMVNQRASEQEGDVDRRAKAKQQADSKLLWLQNELQNGSLISSFRPYLALDPKHIRR
jgi:hypothetical protein